MPELSKEAKRVIDLVDKAKVMGVEFLCLLTDLAEAVTKNGREKTLGEEEASIKYQCELYL